VQKVGIKIVVKSMRSFADLTQEELARKVGFSKRAIVDYEGGVSIPPVDKFIEIAIACEITPPHIACLLTELSTGEVIDFTQYNKNEELVAVQREALDLAKERIATLELQNEELRKKRGKGKN